MGAGEACAKVILVIINILFGLIGFLLLAAGLMVKFGQDLLKDQTKSVMAMIPKLPAQLSMTGVKFSTTNDLDLSELLEPVAIGLIVFGAFVFIVAMMGCCGACCCTKCLMVLYLIIMLILFIAQVVIVALLFTGQLKDKVREMLIVTIKADYQGIDCFEPNCLAWNFVMMEFKCCGVDSYNDFRGASKWKSTRNFIIGGVEVSTQMQTPVACCKLSGSFPNASPVDEACSYLPTVFNSNYLTGCWNKLKEMIDEYNTIAYGVLGGILGFQLILIVMVVVVVHSAFRDDDSKTSPE